MFISPDPLLAFQGERGTFRKRQQIRWKDTIAKIRELYFGYKLKQCAALCDDALINKPAHPLHETFLHFYAAICHESLGLLAHNYSNNKLPFFNQARHNFTAALAVLPLPYCTTENGIYDCLNESPHVLEFPSSLSIHEPKSPTPLPQLNIPDVPSDTISCEDSEEESCTSSVPNFDGYTLRQFDFSIDDAEYENNTLVPCQLTCDQRKRLSQSLSTGHVVQEALLPKPLLLKKTASLQPPQASRALPPIPARDPVLRKTALQTLLNPSVFTIFDSSPVTPRFNQIRDIFDPKYSQASRPWHLQKYNILLSGFRTQLLQHIASIDANISKTTTLQIERNKNKTSRLASFWSIKEEDVEAREKKARIDRLRTEGWNVNKRTHGWKGEQYYAELRSRALVDVGC